MAFLAPLAEPLIAQGGSYLASKVGSKLLPVLGQHTGDVVKFAEDKGVQLAKLGFKKLANNIFNMGKKNKSIRTLFNIGKKVSNVLGNAGVNANTLRTGIDIGGNLLGKDVSKVHEMATKAMAIHDNLGKLIRMENKPTVKKTIDEIDPQDFDQ